MNNIVKQLCRDVWQEIGPDQIEALEAMQEATGEAYSDEDLVESILDANRLESASNDRDEQVVSAVEEFRKLSWKEQVKTVLENNIL